MMNIEFTVSDFREMFAEAPIGNWQDIYEDEWEFNLDGSGSYWLGTTEWQFEWRKCGKQSIYFREIDEPPEAWSIVKYDFVWRDFCYYTDFASSQVVMIQENSDNGEERFLWAASPLFYVPPADGNERVEG